MDVTAPTLHRLLFDNQTFATYLAFWGQASQTPLDVTLTLPVEGVPVLYRLADGTKLTASDYSRDAETGRVRMRVPATDGPMLVDFNEGASAVFVERSGVSAERQLSVEEIIARHQQQQRAQDALVRNYIALARTEQHFRPTMTDPGYDVVTGNRYYVAGRRHRVGRALVLRERIEVGRRPSAVSAAAARESAVAAASAAVRQ